MRPSELVRSMNMICIMKTLPCNIQRCFRNAKNLNFLLLNFDIFLIFSQNMDCGYMIELPQQGGPNEYPQCMS